MSGSPNADLHIYLGDTFTHKQVSISSQLPIGIVRDRAITEMEAHLRSHCNIQPNTMARRDQVRLFGGHRLTNQTPIKDLNKLEKSSSVVAVIPPPPGFSLEELIDAKLEKVKNEHKSHLKEAESRHRNHLKEVESGHRNYLKEVKSGHRNYLKEVEHRHKNQFKEVEHRLKAVEHQNREIKEKHEEELSDLQTRLHELDNWVVHRDTQALDRIILRNLLDKAQAVLAHALLQVDPNSDRRFMSCNWHNYVMAIKEVRALLSTSTNPTMHQLSTSTSLNILMEHSSHIRTDGDNVAHEENIDKTRCSNAIRRCKSIMDCKALNLFLDLVMTYKWQ